MNIFAVDRDPRLAAEALCDKHQNRMLTEGCQLLAAAHWHQIGISTKSALKNNKQQQLLVNILFDSFPRAVEHAPEDAAVSENPYRWMSVNPYWPSHMNHPCAIWLRQSKENYEWHLEHCLALAKEFTHRYGKVHASEAVVRWFAKNRPVAISDTPSDVITLRILCKNVGLTFTPSFTMQGLTPFAQALPESLRSNDSVASYRQYYNEYKHEIAKWEKGRPAPYWFVRPEIVDTNSTILPEEAPSLS